MEQIKGHVEVKDNLIIAVANDAVDANQLILGLIQDDEVSIEGFSCKLIDKTVHTKMVDELTEKNNALQAEILKLQASDSSTPEANDEESKKLNAELESKANRISELETENAELLKSLTKKQETVDEQTALLADQARHLIEMTETVKMLEANAENSELVKPFFKSLLERETREQQIASDLEFLRATLKHVESTLKSLGGVNVLLNSLSLLKK